MLRLYGIPNCDTVKKARAWLDSHQMGYTFHDYKKHGIDSGTLQHWCDSLGHENLLNRRGTTWRKLPEADRDVNDRANAIALMQQQPSVIRRPVLDTGADLLIGFDESAWQSLL